MRIIPIIALVAASAAITTGCAAQMGHQRDVGVETTIAHAANGGIRAWESGPANSGIVFAQDSRLNWYKIEMSGPCLQSDLGPIAVHYTTNAVGALDTFSSLTFPEYSGRSCGVKRITTSLAPPGQPGAPDTDTGN